MKLPLAFSYNALGYLNNNLTQNVSVRKYKVYLGYNNMYFIHIYSTHNYKTWQRSQNIKKVTKAVSWNKKCWMQQLKTYIFSGVGKRFTLDNLPACAAQKKKKRRWKRGVLSDCCLQPKRDRTHFLKCHLTIGHVTVRSSAHISQKGKLQCLVPQQYYSLWLLSHLTIPFLCLTFTWLSHFHQTVSLLFSCLCRSPSPLFLYLFITIGKWRYLVWFGLVLCHINHSRLFNAKSFLYI